MIKNSKIFSFLIILVLLVSFTFAQIDNVEKQIEDAAEGLKGNVTKVRGFTETDKWNFIGAQWKEFLLKNKAVAGVDSFFTKINIVFVIFLGMDWSISLELFFGFLFWIFTFFSINKYMSSIGKGGIGILYSIALLVLLAQINLFEYFGKWSFGIIFFKDIILWKFFSVASIILFIVGYYIFNKFFANRLKSKREEKEKKEERSDRKTFGQWVKAVTGGDWRTENKFS